MKKGAITILYSKRLVDRIATGMLNKFRLYKVKKYGHIPYKSLSTGEEIGRLVYVYGPSLTVKFLEVITDFGIQKEEYFGK